MTFIGGRWDRPELIALAYAFEQATEVRVPPEFLATLAASPPAGRGGAAAGAAR